MQLEHRFKKFLQKYDFPQIRFHDLRHSYATLMMSKGVNPKIVSMILGHSGVDVTLDIYSHPDVSMQRICLQNKKGTRLGAFFMWRRERDSNSRWGISPNTISSRAP